MTRMRQRLKRRRLKEEKEKTSQSEKQESEKHEQGSEEHEQQSEVVNALENKDSGCALDKKANLTGEEVKPMLSKSSKKRRHRHRTKAQGSQSGSEDPQSNTQGYESMRVGDLACEYTCCASERKRKPKREGEQLPSKRSVKELKIEPVSLLTTTEVGKSTDGNHSKSHGTSASEKEITKSNDANIHTPRRRKRHRRKDGYHNRLIVQKPTAENDSCGKNRNHCINGDEKTSELVSSENHSIRTSPRKLLVLDLNGLLADVVSNGKLMRKKDATIGKKAVFVRPFCADFLKFCFEKFDVGIWSSRLSKNVNALVDFLMGDAKYQLLFCWDQSHCTSTGFKTIENVDKPLVLKELKKLWMEASDLPWKKGFYHPSNTLLIDDSPYKALCNPPHTAIFPNSYRYTDKDDCSLGPGGDLRVYLEGLALAEDVQDYVRSNPFGQHAVTVEDPSWIFYKSIIDKFTLSAAEFESSSE